MKTFNRLKHNTPWSMVVVLAVLFSGCNGSLSEATQDTDAARPVKSMVIRAESSKEIRELPGVVKAARETELAFRVGGPLVAYDIRVGQKVAEGDVIARIDPRDFKVAVSKVSAALAEARANLKAMKQGARPEDLARLEAEHRAASSRLADAQTNFERQSNLLAERATSRAMYDNAKTAMDSAQANLDVLDQELKKAKTGARAEDIEATEAVIRRLSADLKSAQNALADTALTAPFDGYISRRLSENHEFVQAGRPVATLLDYSKLEVKTSLPEELVVRRNNIHDVYCMLEVFPDDNIPATIKEIGRKSEATNQSYLMTVVLDLPEQLMAESGMAATVYLVMQNGEHAKQGFDLPGTSLVSDAGGHSFVFIVNPDTMTAVKTKVATGELSGGLIRVVSGISEGDRVITAGARFLHDGLKVRLMDTNEGARS